MDGAMEEAAILGSQVGDGQADATVLNHIGCRVECEVADQVGVDELNPGGGQSIRAN